LIDVVIVYLPVKTYYYTVVEINNYLVKHNNKIKIKTEITKKVGALFKKKISNLKIGV